MKFEFKHPRQVFDALTSLSKIGRSSYRSHESRALSVGVNDQELRTIEGAGRTAMREAALAEADQTTEAVALRNLLTRLDAQQELMIRVAAAQKLAEKKLADAFGLDDEAAVSAARSELLAGETKLAVIRREVEILHGLSETAREKESCARQHLLDRHFAAWISDLQHRYIAAQETLSRLLNDLEFIEALEQLTVAGFALQVNGHARPESLQPVAESESAIEEPELASA